MTLLLLTCYQPRPIGAEFLYIPISTFGFSYVPHNRLYLLFNASVDGTTSFTYFRRNNFFRRSGSQAASVHVCNSEINLMLLNVYLHEMILRQSIWILLRRHSTTTSRAFNRKKWERKTKADFGVRACDTIISNYIILHGISTLDSIDCLPDRGRAMLFRLR